MRHRVRNALKMLGLYGVARQIMDGHRRRQKVAKMRAFYRQFIAPNDLVFDIGANVGNYTAILLSLGARTLSVEPQADCMAQIKARFGKQPRAAFYLGGVAAQQGELELHISNINETSSFSPEWIERLKDRPGWEKHRWYATQTVPVTTLDALIAEHGVPAFIKIDVEGYELSVLQGLSQPVQALSFEYSPELPEKTAACMAYVLTLGDYEFNAVHKESFVFLLPEWTDAASVQHILEERASIRRSGDVYARLKGQ
ncbi:MAG: FkbM family methyltransferase [Chloroflexi bacterium CFX4]|nr:FkbM family methyltransferase [Chloroflexi bacterium CFX4]MDL1924152.1 FkbM family methyltransferase [Chloroflexi bacterium CFX3]